MNFFGQGRGVAYVGHEAFDSGAVTPGSWRTWLTSCRYGRARSRAWLDFDSLSTVKPRPYQQQCRSNIVECYNVEYCFDNVERCFDNVASTLLLVWTGLNVGCVTDGRADLATIARSATVACITYFAKSKEYVNQS